MNKQLLIILMAVCLVSTHAFVKRDATLPTADDVKAQFDIAKAKFEELAKQLNEAASKNLNPDTIKDNFNGLVDAVTKALDSLKPVTEVPKPAA